MTMPAGNLHLQRVRSVIVDAAESLRRSLALYWPTYGDTGLLENNISLHVAHAMWSRGYTVFGEAHPDGTASWKVDLLALGSTPRHLIVCEFKLLYKQPKAVEMVRDYERVRTFRPVGTTEWSNAPRIGLLAAFAFQDRYVLPFTDEAAAGARCPVTTGLLATLPHNSLRGAVGISDSYGKTPADVEGRLHLVYAVFDCPG